MLVACACVISVSTIMLNPEGAMFRRFFLIALLLIWILGVITAWLRARRHRAPPLVWHPTSKTASSLVWR